MEQLRVVKDDAASPNTLLSYTYTGSNLSTLTDVPGARKVVYATNSQAGATVLL